MNKRNEDDLARWEGEGGKPEPVDEDELGGES